jgi:hypothetical protein
MVRLDNYLSEVANEIYAFQQVRRYPSAFGRVYSDTGCPEVSSIPKAQRSAPRVISGMTLCWKEIRMIRKARNPLPRIFNRLPAACLLLALLMHFLPLISAVKAASLPEHPLEPVNTSGPRATLRTFISNADNALAEFKSAYR